MEPGWLEAYIVQTEPLVADPDNGLYDLVAAQRSAERSACAALVRAAGCGCPTVAPGFMIDTHRYVNGHHPQCPIALADAIEARKEG